MLLFLFYSFTASAASQYKTGRNGICMAHTLALPTADTFGAIDIFRYFHAHGTDFLTSTAMVTA